MAKLPLFGGQVAPVSEILSALAQEHPVLNNASNYTTQIQDEILVVSFVQLAAKLK